MVTVQRGNISNSRMPDIPISNFQQQQDEYADLPQQTQEDLPDSTRGAVFPSQDQSFLRWLFDLRKESIVPLLNIWRGKEFDYVKNKWIDSETNYRIMNDRGIQWCISLIESYTNPSFIVTDFDEKTYNFRMRELAKVIWNSLSIRYEEFELKKSDIPRVAEEIESKVCAILRGSLDNGYRDFFSTQNQNIETKSFTPFQPQQKNMFQKLGDYFKRGNPAVAYDEVYPNQ